MQTEDIQLNEDRSANQAQLDVGAQLEKFEKGTQYVKLLRPATVGGGLFKLKDAERKAAMNRFEEALGGLKPTKFVPASGAATRMFKRVYAWIDAPEDHQKAIKDFFDGVEELPFFDAWMDAADKADIETFRSGLSSQVAWLKLLVGEEGLGFANRPKGLIPFHLYDQPCIPIEEHLKEAMAYAQAGEVCRVHFTVSAEHLLDFERAVEEIKKREPYSGIGWQISFSTQASSTDTVAVDLDNNPIKEGDGLLLRPGGHGALIHNLNALEQELVFIKNIDNVCHEKLLATTVEYKKALAGLLLELREDLKMLDGELNKGLMDENSILELREKWGIRIPKDLKKLRDYLKRPIRVCGMVKNEGEPGGGPFYTLDPVTGESLQIVEQAQIDPDDSRQQGIMRSATHFNPVDLVCYLKDLRGRKINLLDYVNEDQYFIAQKSHEGTSIKALEWPGLWNGAMAHWITIFVEVPIQTFNPVKEVSDLFRPTHRG